jgi:polyisoprenoid-binding protein YceI
MIKKSFFALTTVAFLAACSSAPSETVETTDAVEEVDVLADAEFTANTTNSQIAWVGFKTYSDGKHNGTINLKDGTFKVENGNLAGGTFTIDMNSIICLDLAEDQESHDKLVGHLKSDDFFAVEEYPEARFTITGVEEAMNDEKGTTHIIRGNLSMRDQTKNITFPARVSVEESGVSLVAPEFAIDRKQWNVMFRASTIEGVAKDQLIDDNILLELNVNG